MPRKKSAKHPGGPGATASDNQRARQTRLVWAGSVVFILSLIGYGLFATTDLLGGSKASREPAPDVSLNTANGEFRLSHQKGKVVVLYFSFPG